MRRLLNRLRDERDVNISAWIRRQVREALNRGSSTASTRTAAGIDRGHADALADAIRQAAEHGEHVTPERLDHRRKEAT